MLSQQRATYIYSEIHLKLKAEKGIADVFDEISVGQNKGIVGENTELKIERACVSRSVPVSKLNVLEKINTSG